MSFANFKENVKEGDTVILYLGKQQMTSIVIDPTKAHQSRFGYFPHKDIIGRKFGSKIYGKNGKGWMYILPPSPELWTVTLPHRTQILYTTDISMITLELDLKPGSIVVESGTGSGSLSHAIIRTIKPDGHLYTFDFHQQRVEKAREEFEQHGLKEFVTLQVADTCKLGFNLAEKADAVFLDLPAPWDAIPYAKQALKKSGGRICSFSPCIEQVQRTCSTLRKHKFCEIKTLECLLKTFNIRTVPIPEANLGPVNLSDQYTKAETETKKIKLESNENICGMNPGTVKEIGDAGNPLVNLLQDNISDRTDAQHSDVTGVNASGMVAKLTATVKRGNINVLTSKATKEMPGHTGYLTFASLYPDWKEVSCVIKHLPKGDSGY